MAASIKYFATQIGAYQDISEGAGYCAFRLPFSRNRVQAIRIHIGQSLPAADTVNYDGLNPSNNQVASQDIPQSIFWEVGGLSSDDRVWVRAEADTVELSVYRI